MKKFVRFMIFLFQILLLTLSICLFWIFRPVSFIDNFNSYLICNNGTYYQAGSNFVFSADGKLDKFNDKKARKLCDHGIILDYGDTYSTNPNVNYRYQPAIRHDSNWLQSLLVAAVPVIFVLLLIKKTNLKTNLLILSAFLAVIIFLLFLKTPGKILFCQRKAALQSEDFKKSANKAGRLLHEFDIEYQQKIHNEILKKCLNY